MSTYYDQYSSMIFPPYVYREYPKWVKGTDGKEIIVNNKEEEVAFLTRAVDNIVDSPIVQERDSLAQQVSALMQENALLKAAKDKLDEAAKSAEPAKLDAPAPASAPAKVK